MAKIDLSAQSILNALEQGKLAPYIRTLALVVLVIALSCAYVFLQFRGFHQAEAMDQAQIARALANGQGFSTQYIRPLALWQLEQSGRPLPDGAFPDFTHQPLWPFLNSLPFALMGDSLKMTPLDIVAPGERMVVVVSTLFFLLAALIWFFVIRALFDIRLASFCLAALFLTDLLWQFSISGLPHTLLLFLFALATLLTVKALGDGSPQGHRPWLYLPLAAFFFGLMALAHGLSCWIFVGWLLFLGIYFRRKLSPIFLSLLVFLMVLTPWLVRNYQVCGNPFGLNIYTGIYPGNEPEIGVMREMNLNVQAAGRGLRSKFRDGIIAQVSHLFSYLGLNILAAAFFFSLLHPFKNPAAAALRWGILLMWLFAALGMALFGLRRDPISSNQLHILFVPLFVCFGSAFLFVLWYRRHSASELLGKVFATSLLFLVAIPLLTTFFFTNPPRIHWPPYIPPFIAVLGDWFGPEEILASDMPWAVAWYANRKTLLLPDSPRALTRLSDYRVLGAPISGLYLTPITGHRSLVSEIYKGTYQHWAGLITRPPQVTGFFLPAFTPLPIGGECIIFADTERWQRK